MKNVLAELTAIAIVKLVPLGKTVSNRDTMRLVWWGQYFRPDFAKLSTFTKLFPKAPWLLLTETATVNVRQNILNTLNLEECCLFVSSFKRANLKYIVEPKTSLRIVIDEIASVSVSFVSRY